MKQDFLLSGDATLSSALLAQTLPRRVRMPCVRRRRVGASCVFSAFTSHLFYLLTPLIYFMVLEMEQKFSLSLQIPSRADPHWGWLELGLPRRVYPRWVSYLIILPLFSPRVLWFLWRNLIFLRLFLYLAPHKLCAAPLGCHIPY